MERGVFRQILIGVLCTIIMLDNGLHDGWSTPSIPKLETEDTVITVTSDQGAWIINFLYVGGAVGPVLALYLMNKIGRKWTLVLATVPKICSWFMIAFAPNHVYLYLARFLAGTGGGITLTVTPIYIGEVTDKRTRGALGTLVAVMINVGTLSIYCIGLWVTRQLLALIAVWVPVVFLLTFVWMPESPFYLTKKGRITDAELSLRWSLDKYDVAEELEEIKHFLMDETRNPNMGIIDTIKDLYGRRGNRKALRIAFVLFTAMMLAGTTPVLAYQSYIFDEAGFVIPTNVGVIVTGLSIVAAGFLCVALVKFTGKRRLLMFSAPVTGLSLGIVATFFALQSNGVDVTGYTWVPMVFVVIYVIAYGVGLDAMPYSYQGEIFPDNIKAVASMFCSLYYAFLAIVTVKFYQVLRDNFGSHVPLWFFVGATLILGLIVYMIVPETEGKSLEQIQTELHEEKTTKRILPRLRNTHTYDVA